MYALFTGTTGNALGGADDLYGVYDTIEEAQEVIDEMAETALYRWAHIARIDPDDLVKVADLVEGEGWVLTDAADE